MANRHPIATETDHFAQTLRTENLFFSPIAAPTALIASLVLSSRTFSTLLALICINAMESCPIIFAEES